MKYSVISCVRGFLCFVFVLAGAHEASGAGGVEQEAAKRKTGMQQYEGEAIYRRHCMACHSLLPPPKAAPPVKGLARHYREAFASRQEAVNHMTEFMKTPDASQAICHKDAIKRFGLMPAMSLPESDLRTVSAWVWDQYDPALKHLPEGHTH